MKTLSITLIIAATLVLSACHKKKPKEFAGVDGDFVNSTPLGERFEGSNFFSETVARGKFLPVQFGYDSYVVSPEETSKVQSVAQSLKGSSSKVIIAGFTDERGTQEYNRGLGERRAQAVRQSLIDSGVNADLIQTVSFGSEMPADPASTEQAWALNRRAEFGVVK